MNGNNSDNANDDGRKDLHTVIDAQRINSEITENENCTITHGIEPQPRENQQEKLLSIIKWLTIRIDKLENTVEKQAVEISRLKLKIPETNPNSISNVIGNSFGDLYSFESSSSITAPLTGVCTGRQQNSVILNQYSFLNAVPENPKSLPLNTNRSSIASEPRQTDDEATKRKRINRILASVPNADTANPIAALINFCKHHLRFDVDFKHFETSDGIHSMQLYFPGPELIAAASDYKKATAKEIASRNAIVRLNKEPDLLNQWIEWSFTRDSPKFGM